MSPRCRLCSSHCPRLCPKSAACAAARREIRGMKPTPLWPACAETCVPLWKPDLFSPTCVCLRCPPSHCTNHYAYWEQVAGRKGQWKPPTWQTCWGSFQVAGCAHLSTQVPDFSFPTSAALPTSLQTVPTVPPMDSIMSTTHPPSLPQDSSPHHGAAFSSRQT